ncbi:MAG: hypothetical protein EPO20_30500 [Betaproteobacteria bacterium]|nr:MAG: hypothetical protein EPO20_30500 [Betaproteobacteria bacterium]
MYFRPTEKLEVLADKSHRITFASTGSAKTSYNERIAQAVWKGGKTKVVIIDRATWEGCQLGFPEDQPDMVEMIRNTYNQLERPFPHEVFVPFAREKYLEEKGNRMEIKLPRHRQGFIEYQKKMRDEKRYYGWSVWKPYKITFSSLRASDLITMLRSTTDAGAMTIEFLFKSREFRNMRDLIKELITLSSNQSDKFLAVSMDDDSENPETAGIGNQGTFKSVLRHLSNLEKSGIICDDESAFALKLDKVMRDKETITTFTYANVEDSLGQLLFGNMMRQIMHLRATATEKGKQYPQLYILTPELRFWMPRNAADAGLSAGGPGPVMRDALAQGRIRGITIAADTQTPQQISPTGLHNFQWITIGRNQTDAIKYVHEDIYRLPKPILDKADKLEKGRFGIVEVGNNDYNYPVFACPSLARHRIPGENVIEWVASQDPDFMEMVTYSDELRESVKVRIAKMPTKVRTESPVKLLLRAEFGDGKWHAKDELLNIEYHMESKMRAIKEIGEIRRNPKDKRKTLFRIKNIPQQQVGSIPK